MNSRNYDIAVIGGGIIGLATAMRLTQEHPDQKIVVIEKESVVAQHQTGHNSGVIHAGIYYAPGSQKANFCSTGGRLLREFCDEHGVEYEMCGKIIVAVNQSEVPGLEELYRRGSANGAEGLELIGPEELREHEPHVAGVRAIWSPNTGIIDFTKVSEAYSIEMRENGGDLVLGRRGPLHIQEQRLSAYPDRRRRLHRQEHHQLRRTPRRQGRPNDERGNRRPHHTVQG